MAYLDHTSPEVVELLFAVGKIGVVIVPMNWRLAARELLAVLTDYCAQVLIAGGVLDLATELDERKAPPAELIVVGDTGPHGYENWRSTEARQFHAVVVPPLEQRPSGGLLPRVQCCRRESRPSRRAGSSDSVVWISREGRRQLCLSGPPTRGGWTS
jgi:hypothetical protein